ncbi:MAG: DMT family transporter [Gammaproteobacteria bacterium]|nr:DMT family transporter [Gammaproteobacteria bacterium]
MNQSQTSISGAGYFYATMATLIWSGNFIVARGLIDTFPPVSLAYFRWLIAVIVLIPLAIRPMLRDWSIIKENLAYLCIASVLGVSMFNTLIYIASHTTTAINMSLIAITFPVFIIILSRFIYNELLSANKAAGVFLVIVGVVTLITKGDVSVLRNIDFSSGDLWMLLAAITFAVYSLMLKKKPARLGARSFQLSTFIIGLLFLTPFYIWEATGSDFSVTNISSVTFYSILYLGIFASVASYFLWGKAVEKIGPSKSGMIYYSLPIFSGTLAYIFLGEAIETIHLISTFLIATGIFTAIYEKKKIM